MYKNNLKNSLCFRQFTVILGFVPKNFCRQVSRYKPANYVKRELRYYICCAGRSMIEMLGVLAIITVLSVGGIAGYSKAMSSFKHNKWLYQIETLIFNIKDTYKFQGQYGQGLENLLPTMKSIGVVPNDMLDANDKDLFGNRVSISMRQWGAYNRMNLKFQMLANDNSVQNCHDLLHLATTYSNYIWVVGVCAGNNCDGPYFYRICGKIAPENYIPIDRCREYNLVDVMTACKICAKQSCTALVLFDNNT